MRQAPWTNHMHTGYSGALLDLTASLNLRWAVVLSDFLYFIHCFSGQLRGEGWTVGKGSLMHIVFWLLLSCIIVVLGLRTVPYQKITHTSCVGLIKYLPLFQTQWALFYLCLKLVCHMAPGQPLCLFSMRRRQDFFHCSIKGLQVGETLAKSGRHTLTEADSALSLLYVSKALFHPLFDCVMFSWETRVPICSEQKCLESSPGFSNQYTVPLGLSGTQYSAQQ